MKKYWWVWVILLIGGIGWWFLNSRSGLLDPKIAKKSSENKSRKIRTIGFLPTWMIGKTRLYGSELDELIFLGIEVEKNGDLLWDYQARKINDEDFLKQKENITKTGGDNILGIKLFDDEELEELLNNDEAVNNLVEQVKKVVEENNFDGVNVDFEYQNDPIAILDDNFFALLDKLRLAEVGSLSVDVFVNTIIKGNRENVVVLLGKIDELIIMAYDFHRPGVDFAGSVAPIDAVTGERSILELVKNVIDKELDRSKIVLAYPLYGYEWKTYTEDFASEVKRGWYQMASWQRVMTLISEENLETKWDELSMTPWLVFEEDGEIHQIYFENKESLGIKVKLAKDNQFLGVGFWALGYEGEENVLLVDD